MAVTTLVGDAETWQRKYNLNPSFFLQVRKNYFECYLLPLRCIADLTRKVAGASLKIPKWDKNVLSAFLFL